MIRLSLPVTLRCGDVMYGVRHFYSAPLALCGIYIAPRWRLHKQNSSPQIGESFALSYRSSLGPRTMHCTCDKNFALLNSECVDSVTLRLEGKQDIALHEIVVCQNDGMLEL
jgi:hypothetical protein